MLDSPTAVFPIRFLVQCMVIFKGSVAQWAPDRKGRGQNGQSRIDILHQIEIATNPIQSSSPTVRGRCCQVAGHSIYPPQFRRYGSMDGGPRGMGER